MRQLGSRAGLEVGQQVELTPVVDPVMRPAHRDNVERIARTRPATAGSGAICEAWDPFATEEKERTLGSAAETTRSSTSSALHSLRHAAKTPDSDAG